MQNIIALSNIMTCEDKVSRHKRILHFPPTNLHKTKQCLKRRSSNKSHTYIQCSVQHPITSTQKNQKQGQKEQKKKEKKKKGERKCHITQIHKYTKHDC